MKRRFEDFSFVRRVRKINLACQIALGLLLVVALNFLAARHYYKYDLSENKANSLSPESAAHILNLPEDVEIYSTFTKGERNTRGEQEYRQITALLRRYEYESSFGKNGRIKLRIVDPHFESRLAETLSTKFGKDIDSCVIISAGGKFKKLYSPDLYEISAEDRAFKGEQAITGAIISVTSPNDKKIYFLKGHGEMSPTDTSPSRGLSEFAAYLKNLNYDVESLDLSVSKQVPEDAGLLIIASPQAAFLPREIDAIRKYLTTAKGKAAIFLDLGSLQGLEEVLFEWGIMSSDMLVLDTSSDYESSDGDLIARRFPQNPHPIVKYLIDAQLPVQFGSVRPVMEDMGAPVDDNLKLFPIILSAETSWGEKSYAQGGAQKYDESTDLRGPLPLAMVASRSGGSELGLTIPGGRVAVFGDDNFIANKRFGRLGNAKLAVNTVNWMFDDNVTLNIAPRKTQTYSLTLSLSDLRNLALKFSLLPLGVGLIGILVYFVRK